MMTKFWFNVALQWVVQKIYKDITSFALDHFFRWDQVVLGLKSSRHSGQHVWRALLRLRS